MDYQKEILVSESFLPMKTCYKLIARFTALLDAPDTRHMLNRIEIDGHNVSDILSEVRDTVCGKVHQRFPEYTLLSKMMPGDSHALHADNETLDGEPNHTPWRTHVALIYLNTCHIDFEGGQLCFPDFDLEISPVIGTLVTFPCSAAFKHSVSEIKKGSRYSLAMWFTDDPAHRENW